MADRKARYERRQRARERRQQESGRVRRSDLRGILLMVAGGLTAAVLVIGGLGLFITTSRFTRDAEIEASRDGVEPIDLIDGDRLCDLMKEYVLGTDVEMVEQVAVNNKFFDAFAEI